MFPNFAQSVSFDRTYRKHLGPIEGNTLYMKKQGKDDEGVEISVFLKMWVAVDIPDSRPMLRTQNFVPIARAAGTHFLARTSALFGADVHDPNFP